jgi:hypothetical protein
MEFDECMIVDPDYAAMFMHRTQKAMSRWWGIIQHVVNLFHGFFENIRTRHESSVDATLELDSALQMYGANVKKDFKLMHCFISLKQLR